MMMLDLVASVQLLPSPAAASTASAMVGVQDLAWLLIFSFINCLLIAIAALALFHLFDPILPTYRWPFYRRGLDRPDAGATVPRWLLAAIEHAGVPGVDEGLQEVAKAGRGEMLDFSPTRQSAEKLSALATEALEQPLLRPAWFSFLARGATPEDRGVVLLLDHLARRDPPAVSRLLRGEQAPWRTVGPAPAAGGPRTEGISAAVTAAQQAVAASAERVLNEVRAIIGRDRSLSVRFYLLQFGLAVSLFGGRLIDFRPLPYVAVLGFAGGVIALLIHDSVASFTTRRAR